jgi:hypothetical protein
MSVYPFLILFSAVGVAMSVDSSTTVDIVDFSDMMILDTFNHSYLANNKFRQLSPAFPGLLKSEKVSEKQFYPFK